MYRILLIGHGNTPAEMLRSAQMILGQQPEGVVTAISLPQDQDMENYQRQIEQWVISAEESGGGLILSDIAGGSPFITAAKVYREHPGQVDIITGLNLPMLLEAIGSAELGDLQQGREIAIREGAGGILAFSQQLGQ